MRQKRKSRKDREKKEYIRQRNEGEHKRDRESTKAKEVKKLLKIERVQNRWQLQSIERLAKTENENVQNMVKRKGTHDRLKMRTYDSERKEQKNTLKKSYTRQINKGTQKT